MVKVQEEIGGELKLVISKKHHIVGVFVEPLLTQRCEDFLVGVVSVLIVVVVIVGIVNVVNAIAEGLRNEVVQ